MNRVIVTGCNGFIGMHLTQHLLSQNYEVIGIDNCKPSYAPNICDLRASHLEKVYNFSYHKIDLADENQIEYLIRKSEGVSHILHLAAWPGVRYGQIKMNEYFRNNIIAFGNILEIARILKPDKFLFASSSSIYGDLGQTGPVAEEMAHSEFIKSYYASTKWSNEILARQFSEITGIKTIALRFFTVFGEFGRPDMAYWIFLESILKKRTIQLFGEHGGYRNFTYVKDVAEIICRLMKSNGNTYECFNVSAGEPIAADEIIRTYAQISKIEPCIEVVNKPKADVTKTWADPAKLIREIGAVIPTNFEFALNSFYEWYMSEFKI